MKLAISSQDISILEVGVIDNDRFVYYKQFDVSPEQHLKSIANALETYGVSPEDLETVFVVTGPGSFTASRVSTTIANSIGFTKQVPIVGIENPERRSLEDLLPEFLKTNTKGNGFVQAMYNRPAHTS